jgi:hypothetical protein
MEATVYDVWQGLGQKTLNNYFTVYGTLQQIDSLHCSHSYNICVFPKYSLTSEDSSLLKSDALPPGEYETIFQRPVAPSKLRSY